MEPRDLLNPRILLCKAGRFVNNVVRKNMAKKDDEHPVVKETYINEDFQDSCNEKDIHEVGQHFAPGSGSADGSPDCSSFTDADLNAEVVSNADLVSSCKNKTNVEEGSGADSEGVTEHPTDDDVAVKGDVEDFPILVFEGLERPREGQTDEDQGPIL